MNRVLQESHPTEAANITAGFLQLHAADALMFYINSTCLPNKKERITRNIAYSVHPLTFAAIVLFLQRTVKGKP